MFKEKDSFDNKLLNFVNKNLFLIFFILITIFSLLVRWNFLNIQSGDYLGFLNDWFNDLKNNGGLKALKNDVGNYNAPYVTIMALLTYLPIHPLYSIKMVSIIFDFILAFSCMVLVYKLFKNNKNKEFYAILTYFIVIMLPTVILNSSAWAQCDSIYSAFAIISLIFLIDEKYLKSFIFLGISFAFKLQFVFLLPVYIWVYLSKRKFPIYYFLILPVVNFILCIPSILFGKSIISCLSVYGNQAGYYKEMLSLNFPGIYNLFFDSSNIIQSPGEYFSTFGVLMTITILAIITFIFMYKKIKINKEDIIILSLWSVILCTFLLPHMHDRYMYLADVLSIIYVLLNKKKWYIALGVNFVSLYTYIAFLWGSTSVDITTITILNLAILLILTKEVYEKIVIRKEE